MKIAPRKRDLTVIAMLALLLAVVVPLTAVAQNGTPPSLPTEEVPPPPPPPPPPATQPAPPPLPATPTTQAPPPVPTQQMPQATATSTSSMQPQPHPSAPFTPPANCIVAHAATPAQLCPIGGGLQYYYIGADGSAQQGPWIQSFGELSTAGSSSVFSGTNPKTGKSVTITYLAATNKIRISTFYPDNEYDTNKAYNFTVDSSNNVSHEAW